MSSLIRSMIFSIMAAAAASSAQATGWDGDPLITCESRRDCPSYVAVVVGRNSLASEAGRQDCTGVLVAPNLVLTAAHCLPAIVDRVGVSCTGLMRFYFPEAGENPAERRECDALVDVHHPPTDASIIHNRDYALLRLREPVARTPAPVATRSAQPEAGLRSYYLDVADSRPSRLVGQIRSKNCSATTESFYIPRGGAGDHPLLALSNCSATRSECRRNPDSCRIHPPGSSGAPVISGGELVGVISGIAYGFSSAAATESVVASATPRLREILRDFSMLQAQGITISNNVACLSIPGVTTATPAASCALSDYEMYSAVSLQSQALANASVVRLEDALDAAERELLAWSTSAEASGARWQMVRTSEVGATHLSLRPTCRIGSASAAPSRLSSPTRLVTSVINGRRQPVVETTTGRPIVARLRRLEECTPVAAVSP